MNERLNAREKERGKWRRLAMSGCVRVTYLVRGSEDEWSQ